MSLGALRRLLFDNAPRKLGALALAVAVWFFATSNDDTVAQRSLLVPIVVDGVRDNSVVVGVPAAVEVTLSGPLARIDRLRPESIEALLDLSGLSGDFSVQVIVAPPQGLSLERVVPNEVIGLVEAVELRTVPVLLHPIGFDSSEQQLRSSVRPEVATVRGRAAVVAQVSAVVVPITAAELAAASSDLRPGFAVDRNGLPIPEVNVAENRFELLWSIEPLWSLARVATLPPARDQGAWQLLDELPTSLGVAGPRGRLEGLAPVVLDVQWPTGTLQPGEYTLMVQARLPDGVVATESLELRARYAPASPLAD